MFFFFQTICDCDFALVATNFAYVQQLRDIDILIN